MALDFSIEPFFDDFSEDNKFHRILFRPGYAVQARELTQLQTILQEQIRRHGDHMFKEGAMIIPGQISYDLSLKYAKILFAPGVNSQDIFSVLKGQEIENSAGLRSKIVEFAVAEGSDLDTIFITYLNTVQDNNGNNVNQYTVGDILTPVDSTLGAGLNLTIADTEQFVGNASSASIQRGIYYIKKNFVLATEQLIILDKYSNTPSYRVGLLATENIVYPEDSEILLDNALGSPNYAAPGAARYSIDLTLQKLSLTTAEDDNFIDLLRIENGKILYKVDRTQYAELEKTLARRTYDESGDYALSPFGIQVREYRNNLRGNWAAGEKFIQGDLIKVAQVLNTLYFVAVKSGISGTSQPTFITSGVIPDSVSDNTVLWEYVQTPRFNQGLNTFTAGDSQYSAFTLNDHIRLNGMVALGIEAGKAYVRGYEIEKLATEYVESYKSRNLPAGSAALSAYFGVDTLPAITDSITQEKTASIDVSFGNYVLVNTTKFLPDLKNIPEINLHSVTVAGTPTTATIIGKARIRAFERHDSTTYKVFIFDVKMNPGKTFSEVRSFYNTQFTFSANLVLSNGLAIINDASLNSLIYQLPDYAIANISEVSYSVVWSDTKTASIVNGTMTLVYTAPTGYTFESVFDADNYILVNNGVNANVTPNIASGTIVTNAAYLLTNNAQTLTITGSTATGPAFSNTSYTILATIRKSDSTTSQVKRYVTDAPYMNMTASTTPSAATSLIVGNSYVITSLGTSNFTLAGASANKVGIQFIATSTTTGTGTATAAIQAKIELNHSYLTRLVSVMMDSRGFLINNVANTSPIYDTNITSRYLIDDGHDVGYINKSSIYLQPGATAPTGPIQIKYEYLNSDTNAGGFIGVNSYTHALSNMTYEQIINVGKYPLRDCIDFRPYQTSGGYTEKYFPKYGSTASIKYSNYLPRVDNISLSSSGQFINVRGIPSASAMEPSISSNSMKLARISFEPYTFVRDEKIGAIISRVENKRYTMRDIGKLERRIQDLEYYTSLTLVELETKNMNIIDSDGFDRYQNGFLVDSFDGQGVGNAASDDWNASIDMQRKELRPFFSQKQVNLLENVSSSTKSTYKVSGDLVTLPFTETEVSWARQTKASVEVAVNPYSVASYKGILGLNPWSDTWFSTHYRPDIIVSDESQYKAIVEKAEADGILGTVWNSWQTAFSSTRSVASRLEALTKWSEADTTILSATNNGGTFWRNRATFTGEELDFIGNTSRDVGSAQANTVAGSRVLTIETSAVETTSTRTGTRSFITDKVDSRVSEDRVVDTEIVPFIRPRAVLFVGYGFKPDTRMYSYFDNVLVEDYITPATRMFVSSVTGYPSQFDVERNAGSAVQNTERTVYYNDGSVVNGTISLTENSTAVTGLATSFVQDIQVNDILNLGTAQQYKVTAIIDNDEMTISPAWTGETVTGVSCKVIGPTHKNIEEVEVAFNHGEVIKEYVNNVATGRSAIVVAQDTSGSQIGLSIMNIKGDTNFSTSTNAEWRGEYVTTGNTLAPRVRFISKSQPTSLTSTSSGVVAGIFRIPSNPILKFRTGTREFRLSDVPSTSVVTRTENELTSGGAFYQANGLIEIKQRTIISTRTADIASTQVSAENTVVTTSDRLTRDTGWFDPLAQTFMVQEEGGAFITSVDLWFSAKDSKVPVRIEVREVVNGYPGSAVLPFSRVEMKASNVITSLDATVATTFKFTSPVYLQNGTEYALVVLSDSDYYKIWCSETGTIQIQPGGIRSGAITSQPFNGVLFKSQNASAWTADQTQDMKFVMRRASFSTTSATLELIPPRLGYTSLAFNPFNFISGSSKCRVEHTNNGMNAGETVVFRTGQVINSINGIPATHIFRDIGHTIQSAELDSYVIDFGLGQTAGTYTSNSTGKVGGGFIQASENFEFQTAMIDIAQVMPAGTNIEYIANVVNHSDVITQHPMINKENLDFSDEKIFPSTINFTSEQLPAGLSILCKMNPSSLDSVSPVIDLGRLAMTMISNKIDSPSLNVNDSTLDYFPITTPAPSGTGVEIGASGAGKAISLVGNSIIVNALTQSVLYNNMNNNLNIGDVIRFEYTNITPSIFNMIIIDKKYVTTYDQSGNVDEQQLHLVLEGFDGESLQITTTNRVFMTWLSHYKSEYAAIGGSTHSKYVTKKINFSRPSEMLRIMFSAQIPAEAEVDIYYKTGSGVSGDFIADSYTKAIPSSYTKSDSSFYEVSANVENLESFDSVIVKLVMRSINKSKIPRIKDFRVIAIAG